MKLTWRDAIATLAAGAIVTIYVAFLNGTSAWLISTARGTTTAVLVLGVAGGCALSRLAEAYAGAQSRTALGFTKMATDLGMIALAAAIAGLITGGTLALAILVAAAIALWLVATVRHAFITPPRQVHWRDVHEVIHVGKTA